MHCYTYVYTYINIKNIEYIYRHIYTGYTCVSLPADRDRKSIVLWRTVVLRDARLKGYTCTVIKMAI